MKPHALLVSASLALLLAAPGVRAQESRGSVLPCAAPLAWRVGDLDARFGLTRAEAREAVAAATALWEEAAGRPLFPEDARRGFPVSFVYDERQETYLARRGAQDELEREGAVLDSVAGAVEARRSELEGARAEHDGEVRALLERMDAYNREVARWNRGGGAPGEERTRLAARAATLEEERLDLQRRATRLDRAQGALSDEIGRLNARIEERNRRARELMARYGGRLTEAGRYDERVRTTLRGPRVEARSIRVFRFEDRHDLVQVLAHELGHALGLGHVEDEGAVMSSVMHGGAEGPVRLAPTDLRLLLSRCPELR